MLLLREPFWLLFLTAFIGLLFGRMKGRPGWGFLLGLFFGPLGLALTLLMPARRVQAAGRGSPFTGRAPPFSNQSSQSRQAPPDTGGSDSGSGPVCPRCSKTVGRSDKTCSNCGNVLMPIRYEVRGPGSA